MSTLAPTSPSTIEYTCFHLFCGCGSGAKGWRRGTARLGNLKATWRNIGGVDSNPAAIADFERFAGVKGTVLDLFERHQYTAYHGKEPPRDWRQATPLDIRMAAGGEYPTAIFLSAPCQGFSGLLAESKSKTAKYEALNELTIRGMWLALEAFKDHPPAFILFENVPRISTRGRWLVDQIVALLRGYGYAVAETTHDCGELGGLAQTRKRFLLVARHIEQVPPFLYEPPKRQLRSVGEILERLPVPGDPAGGPMHRVPALQWNTWVRLAFVEAGSDWRSLKRLAVQDGVLRDYALAPDANWHPGVLGVRRWHDTSGTVAGRSGPTNGAFNVADPRIAGHPKSVQLGVRQWGRHAPTVKGDMSVGTGPYAVADPLPAGWDRRGQLGVSPWDKSIGTVTGQRSPAQGLFSVADPRGEGAGPRFNNVFRVVRRDESSPSVTGGSGPSAGGLAVADPVGATSMHGRGKYSVVPITGSSRPVIAASGTGNGAYAVADPRPATLPSDKVYRTARKYGVQEWDSSSLAVSAAGQHDNGPWSVADPHCDAVRPQQSVALPSPKDRLVCVIVADDQTWHRPFTTLELAALQSMVDPEDFAVHADAEHGAAVTTPAPWCMEGESDTAWRERIGNAVPADSAEAISSVMAQTLLLAHTGETFILTNAPIWVQPMMVALAVDDTQRGIWELDR